MLATEPRPRFHAGVFVPMDEDNNQRCPRVLRSSFLVRVAKELRVAWAIGGLRSVVMVSDVLGSRDWMQSLVSAIRKLS